jgi:microcystin-dependent protein
MAFLGTTDPDGWVICNGVQRTNGSDGRYNNLVAASIGTGTANGNYTPPNYRGAFLRGTGESPTQNRNAGPAINASQRDEIENHFHVASFLYSTVTNVGTQNPLLIPGAVTTGTSTGTVYALSDMNNSNVNQYTAASSFSLKETRPYNYGVNWIIKL